MADKNIVSKNTFVSGMTQDLLSSLSDSKSYHYARNAVSSTRDSKGFGLTNEGGTKECGSVGEGVVGAAYNEERNWTIYFKEGDEIWMLNHANCESKKIVSASEFGCDWGFDECEWMGENIEFKTMGPCNELHVYFSSNWDFHKVNIDLMLDSDRKAGLKKELDCETKCGYLNNCEYFNNFKKGCAPTINPKSFKNGGGQLQAGAYTFVPRYKHIDGGFTNWFNHSNTVFIESEHNIAGEQSNGHIEISMSGLDCKFGEIEIVVIEDIGGIITAKTLNTVNYNNHHYTYRYNGNDGIPIDISEVLTKEHVYLQGRHIEQKDGHMLYYGIKPRKNPNIQTKVNQIVTEYVVYEMLYEDVKKYNIRSHMRDESYSYALIPNYVDGSHGNGHPIPATPSGGGDSGDQISSVSENFIEQPNSNAETTGEGTPQSLETRASSSVSALNIVCEYRDTDPSLDVTYELIKNTGKPDILTLYALGNTFKTDLMTCTEQAVKSGKTTSVFVTGYSYDKVDFKVSGLDSISGSSVTLYGNASQTESFAGEANSVVVVQVENSSGEGGGGGSPSSSGAAGGGQSQGSSSASEITVPQEVERKRSAIADIVNDPQNDHYDDIVKQLVDSMDTDALVDKCEEILLWEEHLKAHCCQCYDGEEGCLDDVKQDEGEGEGVDDCTMPFKCCPSGEPCPGGSAYERCIADIDKPDDALGDWESLLDWYNQDELTPDYSPTSIRTGARAIIESIKKRERLERKKREYNIGKSVTYGSSESALSQNKQSSFAGPLFDVYGINETEVDIKIVSSGRTEPDFEKDITYPCTTDCNGEYIFGGLAGKPVANHKFPDCNREPHFVSKAIGVPYGKYYPDSGETSDLYIRILGVRFSNIPQFEDDDFPLPLCDVNPYTIGVVKRTDSNRKVLLKGLATGTFKIDNNGKEYEQARYAVNSMEEVSFYHDDGDGGRLSNMGSGESHTIFSLDGMTIRPALNGSILKEELRVKGQGERYGLYAKGKQPEDSIKGSRIDALGARSSTNLHEWEGGGGEHDIDFVKYVIGDDAIAPGAGGTTPLMNKSQQECIWVKSGLPQITDKSFTGDVLEHNVPIPEAEASYVSIKAELDNQYGNIENLNYIPLLYAGKNNNYSIEGPVGDIYIGPYSYVKTGFVSDKVGSCDPAERFDIPAQVSTKKEKRCICDGPEDVIHQMNGAWIWTELPEDGDAADPKNWAGTHTHGLAHTDTYQEAVGNAPVSDFYFPGTIVHNNTYIGEFETNPWLREKSDLLEKQWYPQIKTPDFRFDSGVAVDASVAGWRDCYLNQWHREIEQPSLWKKILKTIMRTSLNILGPVYGMDQLFGMDNGGIDFVGSLVEFPMLAVLWYLMVQVLFTNNALDKLLGIPVCKDDIARGFPEGFNRGLFFNPSGYNLDYSKQSDLYRYHGLPDPFYTCDCEDTETSNEIYISDRQVQGSNFDAYTHVKPLSKIHIPANYGKLTNLASVGGTLFAHTTDALIRLRHNRTLTLTNGDNIILGSSGFLSEPEGVTEGIVEGYAGLRRHNEHINSQYGYFFVDGEADIVYKLIGSGDLEAISSKGMFNFFKEKLNFCDPSGCIDQRVAGSPYYALGVDPRLNRFLLTKNESNSKHSFTMSYDLERGVWISFHDYIPRTYIWDRRDMYSLAPGGGIHIHNQDCIYQTYYGQYYPHEIQITATSRDIENFTWKGLILNTEAELCSGCSWVEDLDITFNKIAVWNSTQGTGTQLLDWISDDEGASEDMRRKIKENSNLIKAHKKRRFWRINEIHDFRKNDCSDQPMTVCQQCEPIHDVNEGIFDCTVLNKQNFKNKVISDKYIIYRFIYDHDANTKINTIYATTLGEANTI